MGTSSRLATILDSEMLRAKGVLSYPAGTPLTLMNPLSNVALATQLDGRYLLSYFSQAPQTLTAWPNRTYVTPTPYSPEETVSWLALPNPSQPRGFVLLLNPAKLNNIYGPRWV